MLHPAAVLQTSKHAPRLPVVDHYCGTQVRIVKALALQAELKAQFGRSVIDVTLDCEDGAPAGGERDHAQMLCELTITHFEATGIKPAVRFHPVSHPAFELEVAAFAPAFSSLAHIMLPKVESVQDVAQASSVLPPTLALHALVESAFAVNQAQSIAAHPRIASLSFGLMDFVSSHCGAIPARTMTLDPELGQMAHPLVLSAKLAVSAACHAHAKVPAHCVVTEFKDTAALESAARHVAQHLGYTRMWSIHPAQIQPILAAFAPSEADIEAACRILEKAQAAQWAPISHLGALHDRASYRFYWQTLQSAYATGAQLPDSIVQKYFNQGHYENTV